MVLTIGLTCDMDYVLVFFKYCLNDCLGLIVDFFNIVLSTGYVPTDLSPVLFAPFINDFTQYVSTAYGGLNIAQSCYPSLMNSEDCII